MHKHDFYYALHKIKNYKLDVKIELILVGRAY